MPHQNLDAWVTLIAKVLIIVIPVVLTWFIQTYVKSAKTEKDVAAIVRLSNVAIDYVENLDKQGVFSDLPPEVSKGIQKLNTATDWFESELKERHGIKITNEEAEKWISAEFQKRIGNVQQISELAKLAKSAAYTVQSLERNGLIVLPPDADRLAVLTEYAADFLMAKLTEKTGGSVSSEQARAWVRKELMENLQRSEGKSDDDKLAADSLTALTQKAISTLASLKAEGKLRIRPGTASEVDRNVVAALLLADITKQGLEVSLDDISEAVERAFQD